MTIKQTKIQRNFPHIWWLILGFILLISLNSCSNETDSDLKPAPLNDKETLEQLAAAYEKRAEQLPVSPVKLSPEARKKFVVQIFNDAGFSYGKTLSSLSQVQPEKVTQYHRDLKGLMFMPHYGTKFDETRTIYSEGELKSIGTIDEKIR